MFINLEDVEISQEISDKQVELRPGPYVKLTVRDTGTGIPQDALPRIFDPFFTTKEVGAGTGMGLAVIHGIITAHQGAIMVETGPDRGTAFTMYFPRIEGFPDPELPTKLDKDTAGKKGRILFIDDEESLVWLEVKLLEREGLDVVGFSQPEEAISLFRESPDSFSVVITDQTMPKITGEGVLAAIREIRSDIPVILLTGFSHSIDEEKAKALGFHSFLLKPIEPSQLVNAIGEAMQDQGETK